MRGSIPGQNVGSLVEYKINATDILENSLYASGNYTVKNPAILKITVTEDKIALGQNEAVTGVLTPSSNSSMVNVQFASAKSITTLNCTVNNNGSFAANWKPKTSGLWAVTASSNETKLSYSCYSERLTVMVSPPPLYVRYSLDLIVGFVTFIAVSGVVYFLKSRRS